MCLVCYTPTEFQKKIHITSAQAAFRRRKTKLRGCFAELREEILKWWGSSSPLLNTQGVKAASGRHRRTRASSDIKEKYKYC